MSQVYIAGPMRGYPDFNFPAFFAAEEKLNADGHTTFNPARRDIEAHGPGVNNSPTGDLADVPEFDLRDALGADCAWICTNATAIYMLEGWAQSKGAIAERALGQALGLDVRYQNLLTEYEMTEEVQAAVDEAERVAWDDGYGDGYGQGCDDTEASAQ